MKAIILAAGEGTRMKSKIHKVLHPILDKPMIYYVVRTAQSLADEVVVVVGRQGEQVKAVLGDSVAFAEQAERLGTGHAVRCAAGYIAAGDSVLVLCGDTPLITAAAIQALLDTHRRERNGVTVLSTVVAKPQGYGRIIRENGVFSGIVEQKDLTEVQQATHEINSGVYVFEGGALLAALDKLDNHNAQGEYLLTDTVRLIKEQGLQAGVCCHADPDSLVGINDRAQLAEAAAIMRVRVNRGHMLNGVTLVDPLTTHIGVDVTIGMDTVIYPGCILEGKTVIGMGCVLGPNCRITDKTIDDGTVING